MELYIHLRLDRLFVTVLSCRSKVFGSITRSKYCRSRLRNTFCGFTLVLYEDSPSESLRLFR